MQSRDVRENWSLRGFGRYYVSTAQLEARSSQEAGMEIAGESDELCYTVGMDG
jgi:hypothetical protein